MYKYSIATSCVCVPTRDIKRSIWQNPKCIKIKDFTVEKRIYNNGFSYITHCRHCRARGYSKYPLFKFCRAFILSIYQKK